MIGRTKSAKSRLSTSNKRPSNRNANDSKYLQLERRDLLTTFVVDTTDDIVADDGLVSLREAITAANTNRPFSDVAAGDADGDRIVFATDVRDQNFALNAELEILDDLVIRGYETPEGSDTQLTASQDRLFTINTNERVYLRDISLNSGVADQGGLIKVNEGGNAIFKSSVLADGSAEQGGGIHATDSRLIFDESRIEGNEASDTGGGIWSRGGEVIFLQQSMLTENVANEGGGVFVSNGTRFYAADTTFQFNYSLDLGGGAIWAGAETNVQIVDGLFESNGVVPETTDIPAVDDLQGGAIAAAGDSLRVVDSRFIFNIGGRGGAIYTTATNSTVVESVFDQNQATARGGAVYGAQGEIRINGGTVTGNKAAVGGGLFFSSFATPEQPLLAVVRGVEILANTANAGGGIYSGSNDLRIISSTITDNFATSRGGGLSIVRANLYVLDSTFSTNRVEGSGAGFGDGGGIASYNSTSFIDGAIFTDNNARAGAGIMLRNVEDMTLRATVFENNRADAGGGGVFVDGHSTLRSFGGTRFESNTASNGGGAIYVVNTGRFVARDTSFFSNSANGEGGAILNGGIANIAGTTFSGNRATRGGAIKVGGESALLSIAGTTTFSENVAVRNGAAISSTTSSITLIDDADFIDNVAESDFGQLLFVGEVAFHRITNSSIS